VPPEPGFRVTYRRTFRQEDFDRFAAVSGDDNPIHVDPEYSARTRFGRPVAHGMLLYAVMSRVVAEAFPGTVQREVQMMFPAPTYAGDEMEFDAVVHSAAGEGATLGLRIVAPDGEVTCSGDMVVRWDPR